MVSTYGQSASGLRKLISIGRVIRIAPNEVAIADPEAVRTIYAAHSGFTKAGPPKPCTKENFTEI
jgi:replication-associated recombination protein RarA